MSILVAELIPLYSESGEYLRLVSEAEAQALVSARDATVIRSRDGRTRRLYERADEAKPLRGESKRRAIAGYVGAVKYTFREELHPRETVAKIHMLKRLTVSGQFVANWAGL